MWSAQSAVAVYRSLFKEAPFVVVSNREPYAGRIDENGRLTYAKPAGGLTAALDPVMQAMGGTWIAWGSPPRAGPVTSITQWQEQLRVPPDRPRYEVRRIRLSENEVRNYYHGYANESLWPLCHSLLEHVRFRDRFWKAYQEVNAKFARVILHELREEPIDSPSRSAPSDSRGRTLIWLQDYHLALAARIIRQEQRNARITQFWHIPWPSWDMFRVCPNHRELLQGLLGNDLLAFHLESFCDNFIRCCEQDLDVLVDRKKRAVVYEGHVTALRALPISIDAESYRELAEAADTVGRIDALRSRFGLADKLVGVGVDRLDYSKGILERLDALRILFRRYPEMVARFTFIQIGAPSRTEIRAYAELQESVTAAVEKLNRQLATPEWRPVLYISEGAPREELAAFYRMADVAVVSSLQDGMNLVAKEFVAAQIDRRGVLCLSEFAGAAEELEHAIAVNPFYTEGFAEAIHRALVMDPAEKRARMERMQAKLEQGNVYRWIADFFTAARETLDLSGADPPPSARAGAGRDPASDLRVMLLREHASSLADVLLAADPGVVALDYDGTLTEIVPDPAAARIDDPSRSLIAQVARIPSLHVAVLSGRSVKDASERIAVANVAVVGNHGLELEGWSLPDAERSRSALTSFIKKIQSNGSLLFPAFVEDKGATATVHLRGTRADQDRDRLLEALQVRLDSFLSERTPEADHGLAPQADPGLACENQAVLLRLHPGKASVEIRPAVAWDKARALLHLLEGWGASPEHTFYAGDDETDECVFAELSAGMTVKVGGGPSRARYVAADPSEIYDFLRELVRRSRRDRSP